MLAPAALWQDALERFPEHAFLTLDPAGTITSWTSGAERLFGLSRDRAVGMPLSVIFTPLDRDAGVPVRILQIAERDGSVTGNRWFAHGAGNRRYVNAAIVAVRVAGKCAGYAAIGHEQPIPASDDEMRLRDILTAQVADATRRLSESNTMLTTEIADRTHADAARIRLLRRLVAAEEEARRRIARDLHDDLGQQLTALRLILQGLASSASGGSDPLAGLAKALGMLTAIDHALDFLAWEVRPAALDQFGLNKVLNNYLHEWSRHTGVAAMFHAGASDVGRFAPEIEASVYRIAQEALNNIAKHAHATSVNVLLEQRGENLVLVVEDDGVGVRTTASTEHMTGLAGMRERAVAVGGTLEIEPTPGGGTTVLISVPVAA
jgi:PAS domain S-box-containing protein